MRTAISFRSARGSEFKTEKEATAKAKEKCDELKTTVYVMEAIELHEPKKSNK
jgi:hypothetical protein